MQLAIFHLRMARKNGIAPVDTCEWLSSWQDGYRARGTNNDLITRGRRAGDPVGFYKVAPKARCYFKSISRASLVRTGDERTLFLSFGDLNFLLNVRLCKYCCCCRGIDSPVESVAVHYQSA